MRTELLCKDLVVGYEDGAVAKNINFYVNEGDYICILGENGSGKSTLMKTLLGLVAPLGGEIIFYSKEDGNIGYLPQITPIQKDFPASVEEIVLSGCLRKNGNRPFYKKEHKAEAKSNMEKLNIGHLAKKSYKNLSGGQQQRVLLARALCAAENMLLMDEPTAGLDALSQAEMYDYIEKLNKEGMTIIMISHDLDAALKYATHILQFEDRSIRFQSKSNFLAENDKYLQEREHFMHEGLGDDDE